MSFSRGDWMERLQLVLEYRTRDLVNVLVRRTGLDPDTAARFVATAGPDLLESWRWQSSRLDLEHLPTWSNVQRLLGGIHANAIAVDLEIRPADVWRGLRTFVPQVLLMADRASTGSSTSRKDGGTGGASHGPAGRNATGMPRVRHPRRLERVDVRL
jgi:hypothetical protein